MSGVRHRPVLMQVRRLGLGRNPLRRTADRIEAVLLLGVLVLGLLAIPAAAALGTTIRERAEQSAARYRAEVHPAKAHTLEEAALGQATARVGISWVDSSGATRLGEDDVPFGTAKGSDLTIWLDRTGARVQPPRNPADSAALGAVTALTLPMLAWPMLWALFRLARRRLDRHRLDAWATEWRQVSPRWTGRQQP
ncbi:hypothetical protein AB0E69_24760 [Kribbella sp. NPDC026611]|uniref:Rv1733c family protein n=1 Tax=Kribbella sp. NPDC026611 TaxID=3154911 RepID=UPI0033C56CF3